MRPRGEGGTYDGGRYNHEHEPVSPRVNKNKISRGSRSGVSRSPPQRPPKPSTRYESYRGLASPTQTTYDSYRPQPSILRHTFQRDPREDHHELPDRRQNVRRGSSDRREDYVDSFSSAAPSVDERRGREPERHYKSYKRSLSPDLQEPPLGPKQQQQPHYQNMTWVNPAPRVPLPPKTAKGHSGTLVSRVESENELRYPQVNQSVKQSPHVFIPASCLPVEKANIKHLENLRAKCVPRTPGSHHVFIDDTGYFITFPADPQGRYQQQMWLKINERTRFRGQYPLDSMVSFPAGNAGRNASPFDAGRSTADTVAALHSRQNVEHEEEPTNFDADDVNFNIRGAAAAGVRKPATLRDRSGSVAGEFTIRGVAATSPPIASAISHTAETSSVMRESQVPSHDFSFSPRVSGPDLFPNRTAGPTPLNVPRQDRDDAASSVSGVGSDLSGSKPPACHVCRTRSGSLIKCSTCNRHYHSHCHTASAMPQDQSSDWQCNRCKRKSVPCKRKTPDTIPESNTDKKQRLSCPETVRTGNVSGTAVVPEPVDNSRPISLTVPRQAQSQLERTRANVSTITDQRSELLDHELLDHDEEADNLVAESFATAPVVAPSKNGGKLKTVKRKISVQGLSHQDEHVVSKEPSGQSMASTPVQKDNQHPHTSKSLEAETALLSRTSLQSRNDTASASSATGPRTSGMKTSGMKAKKTNGPKAGKIKCTSCRVRDIPSNPFGRTICQSCKDSEAATAKDVYPSTSDEQAGAPDTAPVEQDFPAVTRIDPEGREILQTKDATTVQGSKVASVMAAASAKPPAVAPPANMSPTAVRAGEHAEMVVTGVESRADGSQQREQLSSPSSSNTTSNSTDEDDDVPLSTLASRKVLNPNLQSKSSVPDKPARTRKTQWVKARSQYDLGNSFVRPRGTYARLIHLAISDSPNERLKAKGVTQWISDNVPGYSLHQGTWADAIQATMIMKSNTNPKSNNGPPTLKRSGPGGGEDWYELLPEWKDKVERWDATLSQPVSPLIKHRSAFEAPRDKNFANRTPSNPSKTKSTGVLKSISTSREKQDANARDIMDSDSDHEINIDSPAQATRDPPKTKPTGFVRPINKVRQKQSRTFTGMTDSEIDSYQSNGSSVERDLADKSPNIQAKQKSTGLLKSINKNTNKKRRNPPKDPHLENIMEFNSDLDDGDDDESSVEEPLARLPAQPPASPVRTGIDRHSVADNLDIDDLMGETTPVPEVATMRPEEPCSDSASTAQHKPLSMLDMTVEELVAGRPPAVHTKFAEAWPSLASKDPNFDYEAKKAEIRTRPGRKARFGQKRPVDVEKILGVIGPSKDPPWPPIDNSLGLTQEQLGDEMILEPCETWDEFFGTTEQVKPCIVDGKLAFRPVGGKSRAVYKTNL